MRKVMARLITVEQAARKSPLVHPASANVIEVDVRDDVRSGREPFSRIMSAVSTRGSECRADVRE